MTAPRQSTRPPSESERAREAAADAEDEPPFHQSSRGRNKQEKSPAPPAAEGELEDDAWAQCDACQKWRLLPKDHCGRRRQTMDLCLGSGAATSAPTTTPMRTRTVTPPPEPPPPTQHPVSLKDLDTKPEDRAKVMRMKCPELRDALRAKGLSVDGLKETLQARLLNPTCPPCRAEERTDPALTTFRKRERRNVPLGPWTTPSSPRGPHGPDARDGGVIRIYRNFESLEDRVVLQATVAETTLFRQYKFGNVPEPRVHMLLAPESALEALTSKIVLLRRHDD